MSISTGIYLRISKSEGESIKNQREIIKEFMKREKIDYDNAIEYIDEDESGYSFNRQGLNEMMKDVKEGRINCIIIKDLSRLGRNYIEIGRLMEEVFPKYMIRVIAVNECDIIK